MSVDADKMLDTVYFDIYSIGVVSTVERRYELEQVVIDSADNAEPGVHYKAFDDPEVSRMYVIPAHSAHAVVPGGGDARYLIGQPGIRAEIQD